MHMHNSHPCPRSHPPNLLGDSLRHTHTPMRPIPTTNTQCNIPLSSVPPPLLTARKPQQFAHSFRHSPLCPWILHNVILYHGRDARVQLTHVLWWRPEVEGGNGPQVGSAWREMRLTDVVGVVRSRRAAASVGQEMDCEMSGPVLGMSGRRSWAEMGNGWWAA